MNGDQQMDVFRFYSSNGELVREEMDVNFDGAVDRVRHFDGAAVTPASRTPMETAADTVRYYRGALFRVEVERRTASPRPTSITTSKASTGAGPMWTRTGHRRLDMARRRAHAHPTH